MKRTITGVALVLALGMARPVAAQDAGHRLLPAAGGAALGVIGGGYVALSVIVAEARAGKYVHDAHDLFGWRSMPVIAGAALGGGLGYYSPERLQHAVLLGYAGLGAGGLIGLGLGSVLWKGPEGKWSGAAIGAGAGLAIGYLAGALTADSDQDLGGGGAQARIPVGFTVRVR